MRKRLFRDSAIAIILSLVIAFVIAIPFVKSIHMQQLQNDLKNTITLLEHEYENDNDTEEAFADRYTQLLAQNGQDIRITILDTAGNVLGESEVDTQVEQNHLNREEVKEAMASGWGFANRKSTVTHSDYFYAAHLKNGIIFRVAVPLDELQQFDNTLLLCSVIGILVGFIIALLLSSLLSKRFVKPIEDMSVAAGKIAKGDLSVQVEQAPYELGRLSQSLNKMAKELKQTQSELQTTNENLHSILQGMDDGVIAVKGDTIVLLTARAVSMLGDPPSDAKLLTQCGANYLFIHDIMTHAKQSEESVSEYVTIHTPDEKILHVYASRIHPSDPNSALAVISDVTKIRKLENLRSEFVANVTHELKTPLTSIRGYVELLKNADRAPEERKQFCEIIDIEAERLSRLIGDLLELSHLENTGRKEPLEKVDIEQVVTQVLKRTSSLSEAANITVTSDIEPGLAITANRERIEEVIENLVDNAIKYGNPKGHVSVTARQERGAAVLRVSDDGIGIPEESLPRIFERFYRVDKGRSRENGGTGLGLSIVKHIVSLYNGDIGVESKPSKGSVFTVRFPLDS